MVIGINCDANCDVGGFRNLLKSEFFETFNWKLCELNLHFTTSYFPDFGNWIFYFLSNIEFAQDICENAKSVPCGKSFIDDW